MCSPNRSGKENMLDQHLLTIYWVKSFKRTACSVWDKAKLLCPERLRNLEHVFEIPHYAANNWLCIRSGRVLLRRIERLSEAASHQSSANYAGCPCSCERNEERRGGGRQSGGYWLITNSAFALPSWLPPNKTGRSNKHTWPLQDVFDLNLSPNRITDTVSVSILCVLLETCSF